MPAPMMTPIPNTVRSSGREALLELEVRILGVGHRLLDGLGPHQVHPSNLDPAPGLLASHPYVATGSVSRRRGTSWSGAPSRSVCWRARRRWSRRARRGCERVEEAPGSMGSPYDVDDRTRTPTRRCRSGRPGSRRRCSPASAGRSSSPVEAASIAASADQALVLGAAAARRPTRRCPLGQPGRYVGRRGCRGRRG